MFALGIFFLALGIYGAYYLFAVELPSGHSTRLPFAVVGSILFGLFMILRSYSVFIPLKKNSYVRSVVCPLCGNLVEEDATVCDKCKQPLETSTTA
jgi:hypothetical protein